jgi:putative peptidoglycan lipid II flippase
VRLRWLVAQGLPFSLAILAATLYGRVGVVLLHTFARAAEVGQFQVAYLLTQPFGFVASAVSVAAFPLLARRADRNDGAFGRALRQAVRWQLFITLPLTAALIVLAHPLVATLFRHHKDFNATASAIQLIAPGMTVIFLNLTARYALPALGRQRRYLHATLAGLAANTVVGLLLIPRFGVPGAVGAFLAAELVILVTCQRALAPHLNWADLARDAWRPLIAALVMGAVVAWLRQQSLVLVVPVGVAVYAVALWLTGAVSDSERRAIGRLVTTTPWHPQTERRSVA